MLRYLLPLFALLIPAFLFAGGKAPVSFRSDCKLPLAEINLEINNVRARLSSAGVMWRNKNNAGYAVPKVNDTSIKDEVHAFFAGAFWLSGYDEYDNLKVAANTYRSQTSIDFWPGPIDELSGSTNSESCQNWDRLFEVKGDEIRSFKYRFQESFNSGIPISSSEIPHSLKAWPGNGNPHFAAIHGFEMDDSGTAYAPYYDFNGDGIYDPVSGDFPVLDFGLCGYDMYADQMIYSVFNDIGNIHTSSRGFPIGAEVHLMDYAFSSDDVLNDVTFKKYKMILRSNDAMVRTYASLWVDPDLGCYNDDYMGSDSSRSLIFLYNSDEMDGYPNGCFGINTYGDEIPMIGIDFLSGPESGISEHPMSSFIIASNTSIIPPPEVPSAIVKYRYASGKFGDGTLVTRGGTGYNPASTDVTNFMFSGRPDITTEWSMCQIGAVFFDYRAVMSSGPFSWQPGGIKVLDAGIVYVPNIKHPCPDIDPLLRADEEMQAAFDACFKLESEGPNAPFAKITSKNRNLIINWNYDYLPGYEDNLRVQIQGSEPASDERYFYKWEGIKIFQLRDANVSRAQLYDTSFAKLVFQCDLQNEVDSIYNWIKDVNSADYISRLMVSGQNQGLQHEIHFSHDLFDQGMPILRSKEYHFAIIAYSHNDFSPYDPDRVGPDRKSYIESAVYRYVRGKLPAFDWDGGVDEEIEDDIRTPFTGNTEVSDRSNSDIELHSVETKIFDFTGKVLFVIRDLPFAFSEDKLTEESSWQNVYHRLIESGYKGTCLAEVRSANGKRRVRKFITF